MRQLFFFCTFLLLSMSLLSQSTFDKSTDATDIKELTIILDNTFLIEISNTSENKIIASAISEGEYQNNMLLKMQRDEHKIIIQDDIQPFSKNHNDKLSAHKVTSLKIKIQIPQHIKVTIRSRIASLEINAILKSLFVELNSGNCQLHHFIGNAKINTLTGDIMLFTKNATIKTSTKSGIINSESIWGQHQIELNSISGNISVYKTK
ncbi:hypothetical protein [Aquimarina sp. 2201CG14-23]|uniref:hypothetical protein n=1 Tax=Aquimarina mycalae TaxID=3040073 RepID=UPI002478217D|nr:hypothetical protein [Aquimarina sp. 2201CG14-23]MDH7446162.1 hypothetical protein [Aquimarina sp. 2201CG14-23]